MARTVMYGLLLGMMVMRRVLFVDLEFPNIKILIVLSGCREGTSTPHQRWRRDSQIEQSKNLFIITCSNIKYFDRDYVGRYTFGSDLNTRISFHCWERPQIWDLLSRPAWFRLGCIKAIYIPSCRRRVSGFLSLTAFKSSVLFTLNYDECWYSFRAISFVILFPA